MHADVTGNFNIEEQIRSFTGAKIMCTIKRSKLEYLEHIRGNESAHSSKSLFSKGKFMVAEDPEERNYHGLIA